MLPKRLSTATLLIALALAGCGEDTPNPVGPSSPSPPADLPAFFSGLPSWDVFSPQMPEAEVPLGDPVEDPAPTDIDGAPYQCTTTPYSLTTTPEDIVTLNPDVEVLWVGSLLQGDGHLGGIGSLAELPVRQRAPVAITLDLLSGANTETVDDPTVATVNQAIGRLVDAAHQAGHRAGSNIFYTSETAHSLEQAALKMGLSASYMGASIKTSLSAEISSETRTVTAYFIQRMFTASMVLPQNPEEVFSEEFTQEMLEREETNGRMGPDNLPVYVSSVTYGRILMFSFTSSSTESKIKATLNALYNGGDFEGSLDTDLQDVLDQATIKVVTVGGDAQHALDLIRDNNLSSYFATDAALTTARPISYTVRNLDDNVIARVSETTTYDLEQCIPADVPVTGGRYRVKLWKVVAEALPYIDWPFSPIGGVLDLTDNYNGAELYYTLYVEGVTGGTFATNIGAQYTSTFGNRYAARVAEGGTHLLVNSNGSAIPSFEMDLHFDGRDYIRVFGTLYDYDHDSPDDPFAVSRLFQWPNKALPTHDDPGVSTAVVSDSDGNRFRVYFTWQKILDLTD